VSDREVLFAYLHDLSSTFAVSDMPISSNASDTVILSWRLLRISRINCSIDFIHSSTAPSACLLPCAVLKVPYDPRGERPASSTDQATWGEFADVLRTYFLGDCGIDGIGLVLTPSDGFVGIDLDHCVNDAKILTWALKIIFELESYSEFSPSGSGVRIFLDGKLPPGGRKRGSVEMYESGRYFTVAGQHYPKSPGTIEQRQEAIEALHKRVFSEQPKPERGERNVRLELNDGDLLKKAFAARNGTKIKALYDGLISSYPSRSEADLALCSGLAFYTSDPAQLDRLFRSSGLFREKWDQRHHGDGRTYGEGTILKATGQQR
jgi:putative DNA primase/helicase